MKESHLKIISGSMIAAVVSSSLLLPRVGHAESDLSSMLSWSAFGTIGGAISNRDYHYQRFVDDEGTVRRDSLLGLQVDAQFNPLWSATVQTRLAPATDDERQWEIEPTWAFLSWRPNNNWLVRAGKLRVPVYLRSEYMDVGATYAEAQLPQEIYAISPTTDFWGGSVTRNFEFEESELSLEMYAGKQTLEYRSWVRDGLPPVVEAGANFREVDVFSHGLVATWRGDTSMYRIGMHQAKTELHDDTPFIERPVFAILGPGLGYYQTSNALPGPGVRETDSVENIVFTVGGQKDLSRDWRIAGELARNIQHDTVLGANTLGGYATLYRKWQRVTGYATIAGLRSTDSARSWVQRLDETSLPSFPMFAPLNASMKITADSVPVYDQKSFTLGAAYAVTPNSTIKTEWQHTRAHMSSMFDLPTGEPLRERRSVDVFSVNYNFVF